MKLINHGHKSAWKLFRATSSRALFLSLLLITSVLVQAGQERGAVKPVKEARVKAATPEEVELMRRSAHTLTGGERDYDPLMEQIGDARFVLLGEATHGTHEFYRERARITRRLIEEKGFNIVVLEADWPDAYKVNEYVRGQSNDRSAEEALSAFKRFPRWMWRNRDFASFIDWLRSYNNALPDASARVGVYGMDVYSLTNSSEAVVEYLRGVDAEAAKKAARRYDCLGGYGDKPEQYGYEIAARSRGPCEQQAVAQLKEMEQRYAAWQKSPNRRRDDELFSAYQNARVVRHSEAYFRLLYYQNFSTWNLRDSHMASTIHELVKYRDALGGAKAKVVVWAHNTHQGDARMTESAERGEHNVGHLMRQFHDGKAFLLGFTTYTGHVMATSEWGQGGRKMKVLEALSESYSALFHQTGIPNFLLLFRGNNSLTQSLGRPRLERAIGVVYLPATERRSHYFEARISRQFDAVIHWDVTTAVEPLK